MKRLGWILLFLISWFSAFKVVVITWSLPLLGVIDFMVFFMIAMALICFGAVAFWKAIFEKDKK